VTVQCDGATASSTTVCQASVTDAVPPTISVSVSPDSLWPPNHHMTDVAAMVTANDNCGAASVALESITSSEPDNAPGNGDGDTVNDIQDADFGTADYAFSLRAERAGGNSGRTYTVTYVATDTDGNATSAEAIVTVEHDQGGVTEPVIATLESTASGTMLQWTAPPDALAYNVIRGNLSDLQDQPNYYSLGVVTCIEMHSLDTTTAGFEDDTVPAPGQAFFYVIQTEAVTTNFFGTESAAKPRMVEPGSCR